jgi:hypothetical protein
LSLTRQFKISLLILLTTCVPMLAQREPVLKQIDLPHPYYFREMYLPQLPERSRAMMHDTSSLGLTA